MHHNFFNKVIWTVFISRHVMRLKGRLIFKYSQSFFKKKNLTKKKILVEVNRYSSSHISYAYLISALNKKYSCSAVVAYIPKIVETRFLYVLYRIMLLPSRTITTVYKWMGTSEVAVPYRGALSFQSEDLQIDNLLCSMSDQRDLLNLTIQGVKIGDLIYDEYLRKACQPTVILEDEKFKLFFAKEIGHFFWWLQYFEKNNVVAVISSHTIYTSSYPLRIAIYRGIEAFQANFTSCYRLSRTNEHAYREFNSYKADFSNLPASLKERGIEWAKSRMARRLAGEVGLDITYSTKSAFANKQPGKILIDTGNPRFLVAAHCFFDSPHGLGDHLFVDFYHWICFLGELSDREPIDFYIKTHPDFKQINTQVLTELLDRYPRLKLIDPATSHHQIVSEGITGVLTIFGTVAYEYAAMGVPVVLGSRNSPTIAYTFNLQPRDLLEYENMITNMPTLKIRNSEIFEFYFMKFGYHNPNLLVDDYNQMIELLGGFEMQFEPEFFSFWLQNFSEDVHRQLMQQFCDFVQSKHYKMQSRPFAG